MTTTLTIDELRFEVRPSSRRKTLQLTVDRGGKLVLTAPEGCDHKTLESFVREHRFWLYTKLAEKEILLQPVSRKEFVTGESFPYLGRNYRLLLVDEQSAPLKLDHGRFKLLRSEVGLGRTHFIRWYTQHARRWLTRRIEKFTNRVGVQPRGIEVRDLGFRWGSCGKAGNLNFHWVTITLPPSLIEYVIVHELIHLHHRNHTPKFWRRLERAMPDYEERKRLLADRGGSGLSL